MMKRPVDLVVLSDILLGTFGSRAQELLNYLHTVEPGILILNGDIIDIWLFSKRYFPAAHKKIILYLTSLLSDRTSCFDRQTSGYVESWFEN